MCNHLTHPVYRPLEGSVAKLWTTAETADTFLGHVLCLIRQVAFTGSQIKKPLKGPTPMTKQMLTARGSNTKTKARRMWNAQERDLGLFSEEHTFKPKFVKFGSKSYLGLKLGPFTCMIFCFLSTDWIEDLSADILEGPTQCMIFVTLDKTPRQATSNLWKFPSCVKIRLTWGMPKPELFFTWLFLVGQEKPKKILKASTLFLTQGRKTRKRRSVET